MTSRPGALAATVLLVVACGPPPPSPPRDPRAAALALFDVAGRPQPAAAETAAVIDGAVASRDPVGLVEALSRLGRARDPAVVAVDTLETEGSAVVDIDAALSGGASGRFSVHVERRADGTWRVVSLSGPGVGWPRRAMPAGEGLTVSPPPS